MIPIMLTTSTTKEFIFTLCDRVDPLERVFRGYAFHILRVENFNFLIKGLKPKFRVKNRNSLV